MSDNLPALSSPFPTEFAPIMKHAHWTGSGDAYRFRFPNNFGASVIPDRSSWELAVLEYDSFGNWRLTYDTPVTEDVLPGLGEQDVAEKLAVIARLDANGQLPGLSGQLKLKDDYRVRVSYTGDEVDPEHSNAEWADLTLERRGTVVFSDGTKADSAAWAEVAHIYALVTDEDDALDVFKDHYPQAFENGE